MFRYQAQKKRANVLIDYIFFDCCKTADTRVKQHEKILLWEKAHFFENIKYFNLN